MEIIINFHSQLISKNIQSMRTNQDQAVPVAAASLDRTSNFENKGISIDSENGKLKEWKWQEKQLKGFHRSRN